MPAVAVVAGIASAVGGAAAFTAAAGFTLANVAAGLAVVGGVTTAMGAATGNKKLQKFGIIAGVGALAAGGIAALSNAGSTAASTGTGLAANAAGEGLQAGAAANTGLSVSGLGGEVAGASFGSEIGSSLSAMDTGVQSMAAGGQAMTPASYSLAGAQAAGAAGAAAPVAGPAVPQTSLGTSPVDSMAGVNQAVTGGSGAGSVTGGAFDKFTSFLNNNKELTKLGTGLLSGASQGYMADETAKRQQRAIDEQRARFNASISGQTSRY
jgi:hypothetical protein